MNFIIRNLFLIFVLLCAVACSSDENLGLPSLENIDFRVSVVGQSRVVIQKDGSGDFQVGDEVALRVYESQPDKLQDKTLLHCEGNRWTSSLYWKDWDGLLIFMRSGLLLLRLSCGRAPAGMCIG